MAHPVLMNQRYTLYTNPPNTLLFILVNKVKIFFKLSLGLFRKYSIPL